MITDPHFKPLDAQKRDFTEGQQDYLVEDMMDPEFEEVVWKNLAKVLESNKARNHDEFISKSRVYIDESGKSPNGEMIRTGPRGGKFYVPKGNAADNNPKSMSISDESITVLEELANLGTPYFVGGSIRDALLGKPIKDLDIELHGVTEKQLQDKLKELGVKHESVGKQFGIYKIGQFDVALPRLETKIGEKHSDFDVKVDPTLSPEKAAKRRDFTMNALMYNVKTGKLVDSFGGLEDLKNGIIKHVDKESFIEDPLRVYRAAQFAARFGFKVHRNTIKLAKEMKLDSLSPERIYGEFKKMLFGDQPSLGLQALDDMDVLKNYYPEINLLKKIPQRKDYHAEGDVFKHTKLALDRAAEITKDWEDENDKLIVMLAVLTHDLGKQLTTKTDENGKITQHGHEVAGVALAKKFLKSITNEESVISMVPKLVEHHLIPVAFHRDQAGDAAFRRLINTHGMKTLSLLAAVSEADSTGRFHRNEDGRAIKPDGKEAKWFRQRLNEISEKHGGITDKLPSLVSGSDLISFGLKPGPQFKTILEDVRNGQEDGSLESSEEAIKYVREKYISKSEDILVKDRVYLTPGEPYPMGVQVKTGPGGGKFYESIPQQTKPDLQVSTRDPSKKPDPEENPQKFKVIPEGDLQALKKKNQFLTDVLDSSNFARAKDEKKDASGNRITAVEAVRGADDWFYNPLLGTALTIHAAVAKIFSSNQDWPPKLLKLGQTYSDDDPSYPDVDDGYSIEDDLSDSAINAMAKSLLSSYAQMQDWYESNKIKTVVLFRGIESGGAGFKVGEDIILKDLPAASWSLEFGVARTFGDTVVSKEFDVRDIIMSCLDIVPNTSEREFIVNTPDDGHVVKVLRRMGR